MFSLMPASLASFSSLFILQGRLFKNKSIIQEAVPDACCPTAAPREVSLPGQVARLPGVVAAVARLGLAAGGGVLAPVDIII